MSDDMEGSVKPWRTMRPHQLFLLFSLTARSVTPCKSATSPGTLPHLTLVSDTQESDEDLEEDQDVPTPSCSEEEGVEKKLPSAVVIGARKGGTRALLEFLALHPHVRREETEPHFYDRHWGEGTAWYLAQLPALLPGQVAVEKTPGYFHSPEVPGRLRQTAPETRLLLILRHPVRRMVSDYNQLRSNRARRNLSYPALEDLVLSQGGEVEQDWPPLHRSLYHIHLQSWLDVFPRDQILVVNGDKFISEPWTELSRVEAFLRLPHLLTKEDFYYNSTKGFYCGRESCGRTKCLGRSKGRLGPQVATALQEQVCLFFQPHNEVLFKLIGSHSFDWSCGGL